MAAYVIGEIEITDPTIYDDYRKQVLTTITKYGGKFLVRGSKSEALEGVAPKRMVLLEFPSYEQALKWYRSPEYAPLVTLRQKASRGRLVIADGT